jgi:hypothetical protein
MSEDFGRLLQRASDLPGGPALAPVPEIVHRAHARRRRRRLALTATVAAAAAVAIAVPTVLLRGTASAPPIGNQPTPYPTSGPSTAAALAGGHWSTLATNAVLHRQDYVSAWTGRQLIVWGGAETLGGPPYDDGALYDPATDRWTAIRSGVLSPRTFAAAVWTGSALFIWGGGYGNTHALQDGALYDPATRIWTKLPAAPIHARIGGQALLVGRQVVVLGGDSRTPSAALSEAAAYDLDKGTWTLLPGIAAPTDGLTDVQIKAEVAVAGGQRIYLWTGYTGRQTMPGADARIKISVAMSRYDLGAGGGWVPVQPYGLAYTNVLGQRLWTGQDVLLPATDAYCAETSPCGQPLPDSRMGQEFYARIEGWRTITAGPTDRGGDWPAVWTGGAMVRLGTSFNPGTGAGPPFGGAWDPNHNRWYDLPPAPTPMLPAVVVWTGDRLLALGVTTFSPGHPPVGVLLALHP